MPFRTALTLAAPPKRMWNDVPENVFESPARSVPSYVGAALAVRRTESHVSSRAVRRMTTDGLPELRDCCGLVVVVVELGLPAVVVRGGCAVVVGVGLAGFDADRAACDGA